MLLFKVIKKKVKMFSIHSRKGKRIVSITLFIIFITIALHSQEQPRDLNQYYRFPLSLSVEYQSYNPAEAYGTENNIFEIAGYLRWPIPPLPILQPLLKGGMISFDSLNQENPYKWDHTHWFGGMGMNLSHRFAKEFEIGAELSASITQAVFPNLDPETGTIGTTNIIAEGGIRLGLNPSYNFNVDVHPSVKYFHSLSPLTNYNGFIFGLGFSGSFRFGEDPDSPQAIIRSIRFDNAKMPAVFAAMQSYYVHNPIGSITIINTENHPIKDINISFYQQGYMDSPTLSAVISEMDGGEEKAVDLLASFNGEVFSNEGITPLIGEIIVTYISSERAAEQKYTVAYDLHDKTAFITPSDSALRNYTSFIRQVCKNDSVSGFSGNLQTAMQIFSGLNVIGCLYQVDPRSPFTEAQGNPIVVDSISLPRDTLKRITGDCDDLTVLYSSLLETVGIQSGFITIPGHIYSIFNTGVPSRDFKKVHPERGMSIDIDGDLWVPVEITMIGRGNFLEAWRKGIEEYRRYDEKPVKRGVYITSEAQEVYRPVGLKETDLGLQYGDNKEIARKFGDDIDSLMSTALRPMLELVENQPNKRGYNSLGIKQAEFKMYDKAEESFRKALEIDGNYLSAKVNLANISYIKKDFGAALKEFSDAFSSLENSGRDKSATALQILLNLSKTLYSMENFEEAEGYYRLATIIDENKVREHAYLATVSIDGDGTARAAEVRDNDPMLFIDEEE
jgi:hypothetical protein